MPWDPRSSCVFARRVVVEGTEREHSLQRAPIARSPKLLTFWPDRAVRSRPPADGSGNPRSHGSEPYVRQLARAVVRILRRLQLALLRAVGRVLPHRDSDSRNTCERLRILVHVPGYPPGLLGGAELSIAAIVAAFRQRGHDVEVLVGGDRKVPPVHGPDARSGLSWRATWRLYRWCDVVFTQLEARNLAMRRAALAARPVVHFIRMGRPDPESSVGIPELVVFNANWLRDATDWPGETLVVHPPVAGDTYRTTPGLCITLVNASRPKGAALFYELAGRFPDRPFLAVRGTWGEQLDPDSLPNVAVVGPLTDMREVYSRTQIVLMPSKAETYGRVGLEAGASGIPTIASELPGVREALGDGALYASPDDVEMWAAHLESLADPHVYAERSAAARARSEAAGARSIEELDRLVTIVAALTAGGRRSPN